GGQELDEPLCGRAGAQAEGHSTADVGQGGVGGVLFRVHGLAEVTALGRRRNELPGAGRYKPVMALLEQSIPIRVRYPEVDGMGYLHHSRYLQYFEIGRVELLRMQGHSYADLEKAGVFFVVAKAEIKYRAPARYDDELTLVTQLIKATAVRYDHSYQLKRGNTLLAEATTTIACVDRQGELQAIPDWVNAAKPPEPGTIT
ncbi:MAG: acyl-CoA thioesterase, partial [Phycisphaerales bacterium]|nr:acyl-CoA thioesterase [Phycisphaerales bacterium]